VFYSATLCSVCTLIRYFSLGFFWEVSAFGIRLYIYIYITCAHQAVRMLLTSSSKTSFNDILNHMKFSSGYANAPHSSYIISFVLIYIVIRIYNLLEYHRLSCGMKRVFALKLNECTFLCFQMHISDASIIYCINFIYCINLKPVSKQLYFNPVKHEIN
jgi:hypothetical protein